MIALYRLIHCMHVCVMLSGVDRVSFVLQPAAGRFNAFDHLTFWVGNAKQVSFLDPN
jgi:hypothetical protein